MVESKHQWKAWLYLSPAIALLLAAFSTGSPIFLFGGVLILLVVQLIKRPVMQLFAAQDSVQMVAMGVAAPSIASALQKSRGKYFPTGWIDILKAFHKNDTIDLLLIAVRPDYQKKGVNAMIIYHAMQGCFKMGIKEAETGHMLETNEKVQAQWKDFDIEQHKRRRCFVKKLN